MKQSRRVFTTEFKQECVRLIVDQGHADYIEPFYNRIRRHSTLGNLSPAAYEQKYQKTS